MHADGRFGAMMSVSLTNEVRPTESGCRPSLIIPNINMSRAQ